jgi:putative drug exporter of the RND superfamily
MYRRLARFAFRRAWLVVGLWVAAFVTVNALAGAVGPGFSTELQTPDSASTRGLEVLERSFPGAGNIFGGAIVYRSAAGVAEPAVADAMQAFFDEVDRIEGVTVISPYSAAGLTQVSPDGTIAMARVNLDSTVSVDDGAVIGTTIRSLAPTLTGVQIEIGGEILARFEPPAAELIGLAFAIVILIVAFGSVLAMGLPIGVALAGVGTGGFGIVTLLSHGLVLSDSALLIGVMIGLGVGIDYSLFIVTRFRELRRDGVEPADAIAGALDTAGRAVVFAGITVVLSLLGMLLIGLPFIGGFGVAAAATVLVTMAASITLLPALLRLTHTRLERTRWRGLLAAGFVALALLGLGLDRPALALGGIVFAAGTLLASLAIAPLRRQLPPRQPPALQSTLSWRWSRIIQSRPGVFALLGAAVLGALTLPLFGLRLGFADEGNAPEASTVRKAYDLIAEGFGPGTNGPLVVLVEGGTDAGAAAVAAAVAADPGIERVSPVFASPITGEDIPPTWLIQATPTTAPQDERTEATVVRLRDEVLPAVDADGTPLLTGSVAVQVDFTEYLAGRLLIFLAAVLGVSFLLLTMVFRSLLVPLKAVIMNVLSIAAAYGVVVAIFQWGWLSGVFGIEPAPIEPFVPIMLFAIVFGLSMDYEVFLLSRVREEFDRTGDAVGSVADGLAATARVITAAAAIMVVVFGAFLLEDDRIIKLFGVGLATAVFLDATVVRMLLVPATMALLGDRNWWIPAWLDRRLPRLHVEGPTHPAPFHASDLAGVDGRADQGPQLVADAPGPGPTFDIDARTDANAHADADADANADADADADTGTSTTGTEPAPVA